MTIPAPRTSLMKKIRSNPKYNKAWYDQVICNSKNDGPREENTRT